MRVQIICESNLVYWMDVVYMGKAYRISTQNGAVTNLKYFLDTWKSELESVLGVEHRRSIEQTAQIIHIAWVE